MASGVIDAIRPLRCLAMIIPQRAAQPLQTHNLAVDLSDLGARFEDPVADAWVVSFFAICFIHGSVQLTVQPAK